MIDPAPVRLPVPILQGDRCLLRALVADDAAALQAQADDVEVARNLFGGFPSPYTMAHARAWCEREANSGAFGHVWGIVVDGAVAGCIGLVPQDGWLRCNAEIGYWLGRSHWRRGIAGDALQQVTDWAFAALPELTRLFAPVFSWNEGSQAVARHCGYVREGMQQQSAIKDGKAVDRVIWASYRTAMERRAADIDAVLASTANIAMERA